MKKELVNFIKKYNLGGEIESAIISYDAKEKALVTKFSRPDKTIIGNVKYKGFNLDTTSDLCIFDTAKLLKMISPLSEDFDIKSNVVNDRVESILFSDIDYNIKFILSQPMLIPRVNKPKTLPESTVTISLKNEVLQKIIKSISVMSDDDSSDITFNVNDNMLYIVIGDIHTNNNQIKLLLSTVEDINWDIKYSNTSFNKELIKQVFSNNLDCEESILNLTYLTQGSSTPGLIDLEFNGEEFFSKYLIVSKA